MGAQGLTAELIWRRDFTTDTLGERELAVLRPFFSDLIRSLLLAETEEQEPE
jgi:hypothetical protein